MAPPLPAVFPIRRVVTGVIFSLGPLLLFPLFVRFSRLIYPGLRLFARSLRPPLPRSFFHEMWILILATVVVIILQTIFALLFIRRPRSAGGSVRLPWGEASVVGGLLSLGVYGVLRGFQGYPTDHLFFPAPALGAAIFCWLLISGTILFRAFKSPE